LNQTFRNWKGRKSILEGAGDLSDFLEFLATTAATLEMALHKWALGRRKFSVMVTAKSTFDLPAIEHFPIPPFFETPFINGPVSKIPRWHTRIFIKISPQREPKLILRCEIAIDRTDP
jgi:hypothetical protein